MKFKGTWKDSLSPVNAIKDTTAPPLFLRLARCLELRQVIDRANSLRAMSTSNSYVEELDEESEQDATTSWLLQLRKEFNVEGFSDCFATDKECVALLLKALGCNAKPSDQAQSDPCGTSVTLFTTLFRTCSNAAKDQVLDEGIIDRLLLRLGDLQAEEPRKPQRSKKFQLVLTKDASSTNKDSSAPSSTSTSPVPISGSTPGPGVAMNPYAYFPSHAFSASSTSESTSAGGGGSTNNPQVLATEMRAKVLWRPGYGTGEASSQTSKADAEREAARIEKIKRTTKVLNCLCTFIDCLDESARWNEVLDSLDSSCLLRVFMSSFYGVTSKAIVENEDMYSGLLRLVGAIAKRSQLISLLGDVPGIYKSVCDLIKALHDLAKQDMADEDDEPSQRLHTLIVETFTLTEAAAEHFPVTTRSSSGLLATDAVVNESGQAGEGVKDGSTAASADTTAASEASDSMVDKEQKEYEESMKSEMFKDLDMRDFSTQKYTYHHYQSQIEEDAKDTAASKNRQRRLNRELKALRTTLPLHFGSTIVFRIDRTRPYVAQFIIFAPQNTPYDSGAFLFDLFCTADYPNEPPKVNLQTTGQGRVRFNPNLYQNGKVCLSLLGTWRGGATGLENWSAEHSSLYQVLVSIQSAILGSEFPYFNEPTVEALWGTEEGEIQKRIHANGGYERLRVATIQYAMTAQIKNPPIGFETCVRTHFLKKRRYIGEVCKKWLAEADGSPTVGHFQALKEAVDELIVALASLGPMEIQEIRKAGPDGSNKEELMGQESAAGVESQVDNSTSTDATLKDQSSSTSSRTDATKQQEAIEKVQVACEPKKDLVGGPQQQLEKQVNQDDLEILKACFPNFPESILKDVLKTTSNLDQSINTLAEFASSNNVN